MGALRRRASTRALVIAGLSALEPACGPSEPPGLERSESSIIGGVSDRGDLAVIHLLKSSDAGDFACTASVIAPTLLLTAAHCVAPMPGETNVRFSASTDSDVRTTRAALEVTATHFDPLYRASFPEAGHDVAVAFLREPLDVAPLPILRERPPAVTVNRAVRLIGYGVSDAHVFAGAGLKREVSTQVESYTDQHLIIHTPTRTACFGDSGGPALMRIGGVETIIGVASFVTDGCRGMAFHVRVDGALDFLDPHLTAAASAPEDAPPEMMEPPRGSVSAVPVGTSTTPAMTSTTSDRPRSGGGGGGEDRATALDEGGCRDVGPRRADTSLEGALVVFLLLLARRRGVRRG